MKQKQHVRFIYTFGHPNSRAIADRLGADYIQIKSTSKSIFKMQSLFSIFNSFKTAMKTKRDDGVVYFLSGFAPIFYPIFMRWFKGEKNITILRANDDTFELEHKNFLVRSIYKFIFKYLDGIIGITQMVAEDAKRYVKCPVYYGVYTTWRDYSYFKKVKPDFKAKNFVFVGDYRDHKGIDILAKTLKLLKKKLPYKFKTYFIGPGIEENLKKRGLSDSSFIYTGKADPRDYFSHCAFYVHTPRYEAGPTTVIEALASGIIPFVNHKTGVHYIVGNLDKDLVIHSLQPETLANHIALYIKKAKPGRLRVLSKKCRAYVKKNDLKRNISDYKEKIKKIIKIAKKQRGL